jgi:hypothetical protein
MENAIFIVHVETREARNGKSTSRTRSYNFRTFQDAHDMASAVKDAKFTNGHKLSALWIAREEVVHVLQA